MAVMIGVNPAEDFSFLIYGFLLGLCVVSTLLCAIALGNLISSAKRIKRNKEFVELCDALASKTRMFLALYAHLTDNEREKLWEPVRTLCSESSVAWILMLDPRPPLRQAVKLAQELIDLARSAQK